jgi:hypothetical protein
LRSERPYDTYRRTRRVCGRRAAGRIDPAQSFNPQNLERLLGGPRCRHRSERRMPSSSAAQTAVWINADACTPRHASVPGLDYPAFTVSTGDLKVSGYRHRQLEVVGGEWLVVRRTTNHQPQPRTSSKET